MGTWKSGADRFRPLRKGKFTAIVSGVSMIFLAACGGDSSGLGTTNPLPELGTVFAVGSEPVDLAISPSGTQIVTANSGSNDASVIDLSSGMVSNIAAGQTAIGVVISPNGARAYVTNWKTTSGTVTEIDLQSKSAVRTITVAAGAGKGVMSGDGAFLFIPNGGNPPPGGLAPNAISKIDTATGSVVSSVTATLPGGLVANGTGTVFFSVLNLTTSIGLFESNDSSVDNVLTDGPNCSYGVFSPNSSTVYTSCGLTDYVAQIDVTSRTLSQTIAVGNGPAALALNPDGSKLFVLRPSAGKLMVISTDTLKIQEISIAGRPSYLAVSPSGLYVLVATNEGQLIVLDRSGTSILKTLELGGTPTGLRVSPSCSCAALPMFDLDRVVTILNVY